MEILKTNFQKSTFSQFLAFLRPVSPLNCRLHCSKKQYCSIRLHLGCSWLGISCWETSACSRLFALWSNSAFKSILCLSALPKLIRALVLKAKPDVSQHLNVAVAIFAGVTPSKRGCQARTPGGGRATLPCPVLMSFCTYFSFVHATS